MKFLSCFEKSLYWETAVSVAATAHWSSLTSLWNLAGPLTNSESIIAIAAATAIENLESCEPLTLYLNLWVHLLTWIVQTPHLLCRCTQWNAYRIFCPFHFSCRFCLHLRGMAPPLQTCQNSLHWFLKTHLECMELLETSLMSNPFLQRKDGLWSRLLHFFQVYFLVRKSFVWGCQ
jgi:hypothetical protein